MPAHIEFRIRVPWWYRTVATILVYSMVGLCEALYRVGGERYRPALQYIAQLDKRGQDWLWAKACPEFVRQRRANA